ncbi:hypothetical protein JS532_01215 [Bifidobacterium callimiconis]|uniref:hypothetical protein n=1 Tax=Bifidobacterium callimiconis TaxID=2306973 RepID=UPI001BDD3248|nr:hypothetical protein [Bifidobacterium callimiconis]MBT1176188.1 hypothetical protein [Bifidobacterium callimiconis]
MMKAILWKDWMICRRSRPFWLMTVLMMVMMLVYIVGFVVWLGNEYTTMVFMLFGPMIAYFPPALTAGTSYPNGHTLTMSMNAPLKTDGTVEAMRCSGRSMTQYLLAKSVLPMMLGLVMLLPPVLYCLYGGALTVRSLLTPEMVYTLIAVPALTFVNEQVLLASRATTTGTLNIPILITLIPMTGFTLMSALVSPWVALPIMLGVGMMALGASALRSRHDYPTTFRRLA